MKKIDLIFKYLKNSNTNLNWEKKRIDFESCLYCDFGNGFDLELRHINCRNIREIVFCLWNIKKQTVVRMFSIPKLSDNKKLADEINSTGNMIFALSKRLED